MSLDRQALRESDVPLLPMTVHVHRQEDFSRIQPTWDAFACRFGYAGFFHQTAWGQILKNAMGHEPYFLSARRGEDITGILPLVLVKSLLFGRFLVGLSYLNTGGVLGDCQESKRLLIDEAVRLADELQVRHLELRDEKDLDHPHLTEKMTAKIHMRLSLPDTSDALMAGFKSKLRSQVKKALGNGQEVHWGRERSLNDFYAVFSQNMRDLGTPVFPKKLFREILRHFPEEAELCILRQAGRPVAAGMLLHGPEITQVPSASTLREYNQTNANMRMYWHLLERAIERGQRTFDFGRSTLGGGTFKFKEQWGARPYPAIWQYYRREGSSEDMRPENSKYDLLIKLWRQLPLSIANVLGPWIVRGIP